MKHYSLKRLTKYMAMAIVVIIIATIMPYKASGETRPITEARDNLEAITKEEEKTLKELFTLTQEIEEALRDKNRLESELDTLNDEIAYIEEEINMNQEKYAEQIDLLEAVLVNYQRGGPASYLEVLLNADSLSSFLSSIHLIKDVSKNINELLSDLQERKIFLSNEKQELSNRIILQEDKLKELTKAISEYEELKYVLEDYMESLAEDKTIYAGHLDNLVIMWDDLKMIFSQIVDDFSRIIEDGYFTMEDLNISFNLLSIKGAVHEDTFNRILKEHSKLPEVVFHFNTDGVILEVPDKKLELKGYFTVVGKSSLEFIVESGSFYDMPLEQSSIDELFRNGPLLMDFEAIAGDMVIVDIDLDFVDTNDGYLEFIIKLGFSIFG